MSYNLYKLLSDDRKNPSSYDDENIISNLYLCSLSTSLRERTIIANKLGVSFDFEDSQFLFIEDDDSDELKDFKSKMEKNLWLLEHNPSIKNIPSINYDRIPDACNIDDMQSVDTLIIDNNSSKCYFIEFKNCNKQILVEKFMKDSSTTKGKGSKISKNNDAILTKLKHSKNLLKELEIDNFEKKSIISKTEVIIVYNKNDTRSNLVSNDPKSKISNKDETGKQNYAVRKNGNKSRHAIKHKFETPSSNYKSKTNLDSGSISDINSIHVPNKRLDEINNKFIKDVIRLGFAKNTLPIVKKSDVAIIGAGDFQKLIDLDFFGSINWGIYTEFFG